MRAAAEVQPLHVEWGGCAEVRLRDDEPVCLVREGALLRLWIEDPRFARVEVAVDGRELEVERYAIDGELGGGLRVPVPVDATELVTRVAGTPSSAPAWSLRLGTATDEPRLDVLQRAEGEVGRAIGRRDAEAVGRIARQAFDLALADGHLSEAVDLGLQVVFLLGRWRLDSTVAADVLRHVEAAALRYPKGRGDLAAYRGLYHWYRGSTQDAAESLRDATRHAVRAEDAALAADAIPIYAESLAQLGYFEDARRWAHEGLRIVRERRTPCELGSALRTAGWINLRLRRGERPFDDPAPFLEQALQVFGDEGACPRPDKLGGARSSLAQLALEDGRLDAAEAWLEPIDRGSLTLDERVHVDDVGVRLWLERGDVGQATTAYERLAKSVAAADTSDARWRLHTRRGRLRELQGDVEGSIAAYREAEAELDAIVRLQAVGIGRGELADWYHESTAALVAWLIDRGDLRAAWCTVRQDQARRRTAAAAPSAMSVAERTELDETIRRYREHRLEAEALESQAHHLPLDEAEAALRLAARARDDARELANALARSLGQGSPHPRCTELTPPAPGELLLGLYPRGGDWLVLAYDDAGVAVEVVPAPSPNDGPDALVRGLLDPVRSWIDAASRVRVLAHREAQRIDVHALPWNGEPLGARLPVAYGVELRARTTSMVLERHALLVADPTATLEGAEAEIELVRERLTGAGWSTTVISLDQAPAPSTVSLVGHDLFHYAGHAEASMRPDRGGWPPYAGGGAGWAAFLELGRAGRITVHDVLTSRPAPYAVVLAGCRTGALELDTGQTSMALAFLVAGAEQVVASAEAVDDAGGTRLARRLYDAVVREPEVDLVRAMQHAQRGAWEAGEGLSGYRVWVR